MKLMVITQEDALFVAPLQAVRMVKFEIADESRVNCRMIQ